MLTFIQKNQVDFLQAAGIEAASINSTTVSEEKVRILRNLDCGHPTIKLLYVTPEYCAFDYFRNKLKTVHENRELSRIAVDEAHCISEWGHDFRPSFKELAWFKAKFPTVPIICLTATSTPKVQDDILSTLGLLRQGEPSNLAIYRTTTVRPNLHYEVRFKSDEDDHFEDFLAWFKASKQRLVNVHKQFDLDPTKFVGSFCGIIYTQYRKDCDGIADRLRQQGVGAKPFHAGLSVLEKDSILAGWLRNSVNHEIIVATTAFGMGIDKENVRFVVHWQLPKSFEGFYQEAGRAGRDGKAARCILYYSREDRERAYQLCRQNGSTELESRLHSLRSVS
jgi:RecQ family ATP-dependent DNA helicase